MLQEEIASKLTQIRAYDFAKTAHRKNDQRRKGTNASYEIHPIRVASIVKIFSAPRYSSNIVSAAYLHDVLEDTDVTYDDLKQEFGEKIADLVREVTKISKSEDGNRKARNRLDFLHFSGASPEGQTIKLADIYDNVRSIVWVDPKFAKIYIPEKMVLTKMLTRGNPILKELVMETLFTASEDLQIALSEKS